MTPQRWQSIKDLLEVVLEKAPDERAKLLDEICVDDPSMRSEIESLLPFYEQVGDFLEKPAAPAGEEQTLRFRGDQATVRQGPVFAPLAVDSLLQNRYQIIRKIGQGGMGAVYEARDQRLGVTVALKQTILKDTQMLKAFEREAHLLAKLRHSMLPVVSDHFAEADGHYLVMQYIPGDDLSELLHRNGGPLVPELVLQWADQLLELLHYLHTHEPPIIHRDIKPNNMKLTKRGEIILLDFGLAKGALTRQAVNTESSLMGYTPHYSPLEQIQGLGSEPRSDLYALAATIYQLLTDVKPPDAMARALSMVNQQADPLQPADMLNPRVLPAVAAVLQQAMAQNASMRPANALVMREQLRAASNQIYRENLPIAANRIDTEQQTRPWLQPVQVKGAERYWFTRHSQTLMAIAAVFIIALPIVFVEYYLARIAHVPKPSNLAMTANDNGKDKIPKRVGDPGYEGDLITLDVENVEMRDVLKFLSDNYDFNFIADESVYSLKCTVRAKDVPWDQMLGSLCRARNLTFKQDGKIITIVPIKSIAQPEKDAKIPLSGD